MTLAKNYFGIGSLYRYLCQPPMSKTKVIEGGIQMTSYDIPYWKKYTLSIEEAASYFRIGEGKLRKLVNDNPNAEYLLWNGNRVQIKRTRFEKFIDTLSAI